MKHVWRLPVLGLPGAAITVTFLTVIIPILLLVTLLTLYNRVVEPLP